MTLTHCMAGDWFWIGLTVTLDFAVAAGYLLIAWHWYHNAKPLPESAAKKALRSMRNIFLFCGLCGYIFIPVKLVWPAWRLYDFFMLGLVYLTWRYAWGAKDLKVVYHELNRNRQLEADLKQSQAESQAKTVLLNALSHDLRTPLNSLMLQVGVAEMAAAAGDKAQLDDALNHIKQGTRSTADLLASILECARLDLGVEKPHYQPVELPPLLDELRLRFEPVARAKGIELSMNCPAAGAVVWSDRTMLARVLGNLIDNAIKFTESGGVRVEAACRGGSGCALSVQDTGIGIEAEHRQRLFEEFYQVRNHERDRNKGFGLGLSIARRLVDALGGRIELVSEVGRGSVFRVELPGRSEPPLNAAGNGAARHGGGDGAGRAALVGGNGQAADR
jgi:signal transduction histidine kinase